MLQEIILAMPRLNLVFFLQKHILLKHTSVLPGDFIKIDRKDNISTLKDLRYRYNLFGEIDVDYASNEEYVQANKAKSVDSETSKYIEQEVSEQRKNVPEETWGKKNELKRKAINPIQMVYAKKNKKFIQQIENVQDIIKAEANDFEGLTRINQEHTYCDLRSSTQDIFKTEANDFEGLTRINQEHTYCDLSSSTQSTRKEKIQCFLFRYNDLFKIIYPTLKQLEIGFYNFLEIDDWESLKQGRRLTNFVVDCAILSVIKESLKNALSLPCQLNEIDFKKVNKLLSFKPDFLFIPILNNNHFNLCILKPANLEFIFVDSLFDNTGKTHYDKFISNDCKAKTWKFVNILKRKKQEDGVSCGVFVILYVSNFLKEELMTNLPFTNQCRNEVKSLLIRNADNCSKFCCHCGNLNSKKKQCTDCSRSVCINCIINKYNSYFTLCKICSNKILY